MSGVHSGFSGFYCTLAGQSAKERVRAKEKSFDIIGIPNGAFCGSNKVVQFMASFSRFAVPILEMRVGIIELQFLVVSLPSDKLSIRMILLFFSYRQGFQEKIRLMWGVCGGLRKLFSSLPSVKFPPIIYNLDDISHGTMISQSTLEKFPIGSLNPRALLSKSA